MLIVALGTLRVVGEKVYKGEGELGGGGEEVGFPSFVISFISLYSEKLRTIECSGIAVGSDHFLPSVDPLLCFPLK